MNSNTQTPRRRLLEQGMTMDVGNTAGDSISHGVSRIVSD